MSILAVAANPVSDTSGLTLTSGVLIGFVVLACLCGAVATGLFRARAVSGPFRLPGGNDSIWRLLFAGSVGCFFWFSTQGFYFAIAHAGGSVPTTSPSGDAVLRPRDWAFLSTVPLVVGLLATILSDVAMLGLSGLESIGLRGDWLRGIAWGLLGIIIAFPLVFIVSQATDSVYQSLHYSHPQEHEMLKVMSDSGQGPVRIALIFGAVILAPVFEETLFRGHVQTFLREWFCRLSATASVVPVPLDVAELDPSRAGGEPPGQSMGNPVVTEAAVPLQTAGRQPRTVGWQTWLAILITSILFAMVHPAWMRPTIFFLAICLGYAYERTGNLWTNIVMHAVFNAVNTYLFLNADH